MFVVEGAIAKKYARAFIDVYSDVLTPSYLKRLEVLISFLDKNRFFQATLSIPTLSLDVKKKFIERVVKDLSLSVYTKKLMLVLLSHGRIELIGRVLKKIILIYKQQNHEEYFTVSSSHLLLANEQDSVISFIKRRSSEKVNVSFIIDKTLIGGIRIKSDNHLWECSIKMRIQRLKRVLLRQEG